MDKHALTTLALRYAAMGLAKALNETSAKPSDFQNQEIIEHFTWNIGVEYGDGEFITNNHGGWDMFCGVRYADGCWSCFC